ncbi:hypothetical protein [Streptococcus anginosus]|uniref:hypothetical protein n=1 Tax=Streptococcus anginosus TaxID=1328 RepID=UPI0022E79F4B|nr:hypothetical protein [Streptococcus anginosus]
MMKETKITAEKVVENIKDFIAELHEIAIDGIKTNDTQESEKAYVLACFAHDISHALYDIVKGKNPHDVLEVIFTDDEKKDDAPFAGVLTVKIENGEVKGIENISNPELKAQIAAAVHKLADELGSK